VRKAGVILVLVTLGLLGSAAAGGATKGGLKLARHDGGFFSIKKPVGWKVYTAGRGSTFSFLIRDPSAALRQVFFFGEVGPVYMSAEQKQIDQQYVSMGGYPVAWLDMPVVNPLTPANFLEQFHVIARSQVAKSFMPQCPTLEKLQVVSSKSLASPLQGGRTELIRAVFTQNDKLGQGLFMATVAPVIPFMGSPGGGTGYGFLVVGISAPKAEFPKVEASLIECLESFQLSESYVRQCMAEQAETWRGVLKAGKTLSETSDMIMRGWENRNKTDDIIAEKRSDAILGKERLYDPDTGQVYEFENGFYDKYKLEPGKWNLSDLTPLPDNKYDLWMKAPLDGKQHMRLE